VRSVPSVQRFEVLAHHEGDVVDGNDLAVVLRHATVEGRRA
jgi:hypothetical protein